MIEPSYFYGLVTGHGTDFFAGVPDSLLKSLCAYVTDTVDEDSHIISANEGSAVGLAAGHYLATGNVPLVYMQNSGIGNAVNPLLSLADGEVYSIPLVLVIGWRGEPGVKDEPQHVKQGKVTTGLLDAMGIPYSILSDNEATLKEQIAGCYKSALERSAPYALIVRKDLFAPYSLVKKVPSAGTMTREDAIALIVKGSAPSDVFVSTTGMASRELYEIRERAGMGHSRDFLTVGSMGHASQIALGIALRKKGRRVICVDGDGATIMQMGGLATIGTRSPKNYIHVVLNNEAHDSVGGQPTVAGRIDIVAIAKAAGYASAIRVSSPEELSRELSSAVEGPRLIEVKVAKGARPDLGRPKESPKENKAAFQEFLKA